MHDLMKTRQDGPRNNATVVPEMWGFRISESAEIPFSVPKLTLMGPSPRTPQ
jgi:hypothetical protein